MCTKYVWETQMNVRIFHYVNIPKCGGVGGGGGGNLKFRVLLALGLSGKGYSTCNMCHTVPDHPGCGASSVFRSSPGSYHHLLCSHFQFSSLSTDYESSEDCYPAEYIAHEWMQRVSQLNFLFIHRVSVSFIPTVPRVQNHVV